MKEERAFFRFLRALYGLGELFLKTLRYGIKRPPYLGDIVEQMDSIGVNSLSIVFLTTLFTGMVLALQSGIVMAKFGAKMYVGNLVSTSMIREMGPVLVALMVAGRVGAGITAEIGSMKVTEQIDALRALGTNPIKKLVATRIVATVVMLPVLTVIGDIVGIFGGWLLSLWSIGVSTGIYKQTVLDAVTMDDILTGVIKPIVFGVIISLVGCYYGLTTSGGTKGVGSATTRSVVVSSISILIVDFFLGKLLLAFLTYT